MRSVLQLLLLGWHARRAVRIGAVDEELVPVGVPIAIGVVAEWIGAPAVRADFGAVAEAVAVGVVVVRVCAEPELFLVGQLIAVGIDGDDLVVLVVIDVLGAG